MEKRLYPFFKERNVDYIENIRYGREYYFEIQLVIFQILLDDRNRVIELVFNLSI